MSDQVSHTKRPTPAASKFAAASSLLPGVALCAVVSAIAMAVQATQVAALGHPYLDAIVVAILLGTGIRSVWTPNDRWRPGIAFGAKQMLEVAVALLGASITFSTLAASGPTLLAATVLLVILTILISYAVSRSLGLSNRLSILVACGNSICGNSAIAAVAPLIGAKSDEIASSIAFTAILGVIVVLGLPLLIPLFAFSEFQYGVLAGMTVYAVPQVLAATMPVSLVSTQIGTVVKLVRVMMLGPVVASVAYLARGLRTEGSIGSSKHGLFKAVPWFIIVFFVLAALRSFALIPDVAIAPIRWIASIFTVLSMAALGLGVDVRVIGQVGFRVTAAVTISLVFLIAMSVCLVRFAIPA